MTKATFGAGCFWGVQQAFDRVKGVKSSQAGYAGGHVSSPSYEQVCSGKTGHAEVVQVEFDPSRVSYGQLLDVFFKMHDATQVNRQGPDIGEQYRSIILFHSKEQKVAASKKIEELKANGLAIATELVAFTNFYPAEEYHQKYLDKRGIEGVCHTRLS